MPSVILNLQIACNDHHGLPDKTKCEQWLKVCLPYFQAKSEMTIRIVDIEESQYLNLIYRGNNNPTNVLSFRFQALENMPWPLLGDLVICHPVVKKEAIEQNKTLDAHWAHMVIHGCFHLLGYDHQNDYEAEKMETIEIKIMQQLGYPDPYRKDETV
ncbi:MAG: rRNA maturation RNase YbeY [Candidatus Arsenophonus melophagi]|nr:rRNA maturation RNase YbeY [Candidatus Arsenophonus melophagi]